MTEASEEGLVAQGGAQPIGIVEQGVGHVHLGQRRVGVQPADLVDVAPKDRRFQVGGADSASRRGRRRRSPYWRYSPPVRDGKP